jgi:hypothetical protein
MNLMEVREQLTLEPYEIMNIERMQAVEAQGGVEIRGLSAEVEPQGPKKFTVTVMGEVEVLTKGGLARSVEIMAVCYGDRGQVCGSEQIAFFADGVQGGEALNREIECKSPPVKLRVFPKIWA